jgi:molecular chaperone DnaK
MELRGVLESQDVNEIRQKTDALQEASQKLAEILYSQAASQAQSQAASADGGASHDDEVVEEADYEVIDEEEGATRT